MKKNHLALPLFTMAGILLLAFWFTSSSCNSKKEDKKSSTMDNAVPGATTGINTDDTGGTQTTSGGTQALADLQPLTGNLYTLKMDKVQFDSLQKYRASKKMVLQFCYRDNAKWPTLLAYPAMPQDKFYPNNTNSMYNPAELTPGSPYMAVEKKMIFGDQEITYKSINDFLTANHINTGAPYTLVFAPNIKPDGHIYYKVTVDGIQAFEGLLETNPSPPKDAD